MTFATNYLGIFNCILCSIYIYIFIITYTLIDYWYGFVKKIRSLSFNETVAGEDDGNSEAYWNSRTNSKCVVEHSWLVFRRLYSISRADNSKQKVSEPFFLFFFGIRTPLCVCLYCTDREEIFWRIGKKDRDSLTAPFDLLVLKNFPAVITTRHVPTPSPSWLTFCTPWNLPGGSRCRFVFFSKN